MEEEEEEEEEEKEEHRLRKVTKLGMGLFSRACFVWALGMREAARMSEEKLSTNHP